MSNTDIRDYARKHGVFLWQVAAKLEQSESTLTRKLRYELTKAEKKHIIHIIDVLSGSKEQ
ncbi:hypothetical protein [uncultured Ruminococcus sp.]|uniref:hypothetical protein n=1 Tax=uncultured Ruminococcus sp. TaxID=165186 RepID=UPI0025F22C74|nr:hypothetical protein [uncultured Ruminococcus sp.]